MMSHIERERPAPDLGGVLDAAPDANVVVDAEGVIVLVNAQVEVLFGYTRDDLVGRPVEMLIPGRLLERHRHHRAGFVAEPLVRAMGADLNLLARRKDGTEFPVEFSLGPLQTEHGLLTSADIRDITNKRSEERRFKGLLESAPDACCRAISAPSPSGRASPSCTRTRFLACQTSRSIRAMVIVDADARIVLVNAQTEALFGYHRSELIGQFVEVLVPEWFAGMHVGFRAEYISDAHTRPMGFAGDLYAQRRDGSEFPVEISLSLLESEAGRLVSAAVRDIS